MKSGVPFRSAFVLLNRVVEATQNQELWERSLPKPGENPCKLLKKSDVPLRFGVVLSELWKPNKTRSCGKEARQNQENPCCFTNCSKTESDVLLCFGFVLSEFWKPNKTRSCGKETAQNQERIHANCKKMLKNKNEIRCSTPLRICIKLVVEAKQN